MSIDLNEVRLIAFLLVLVRAVAWLMVVPPFSDRKVIPTMVTMAIGSGLGILIGPTIPNSMIPTDTAGLIGAIVEQILTGIAMGYVINLLLEVGAFAAWFVILIVGRMPRGLFDVMVLANSYIARSDAYLLLLTETYPPFQDDTTRTAGTPGPTIPEAPAG